MIYKYDKEYFLDNDDDLVDLVTAKVLFGFDSNRGNCLSNSILSILYNAGKPYVSLAEDEVEVVAPQKLKQKSKTKKKKIKIDEPKEEPTITNTESNKEES